MSAFSEVENLKSDDNNIGLSLRDDLDSGSSHVPPNLLILNSQRGPLHFWTAVNEISGPEALEENGLESWEPNPMKSRTGAVGLLEDGAC